MTSGLLGSIQQPRRVNRPTAYFLDPQSCSMLLNLYNAIEANKTSAELA